MFDWDIYLNHANDWAKIDDEGYQRSAISRAYYSIFKTAQNILKENPSLLKDPAHFRLLEDKGSDHFMLWDLYKGIKGQISQAGFRLYKQRRKADYDNEISRIGDVVTSSMATANRTMELLKSL